MTFVRAPLSLDLTTITVFCFRLLSRSQILAFVSQHQPDCGETSEMHIPDGRISRTSDEKLWVLGMPCTRRQFTNMSPRRKDSKLNNVTAKTEHHRWTNDVFFMSRIYGSPFTKVALPVRDWHPSSQTDENMRTFLPRLYRITSPALSQKGIEIASRRSKT